MKRFILLSFFVLLITSIGFSINVCSGEYITNNFSISNNFGQPLYYTVTKNGGASIFTAINENNFFLGNGESKEISMRTYLPFTGSFELGIMVEDSKARRTTYNYPFIVENCHKGNITANFSQDYCLYSDYTFDVNVSNKGIYNETLTVEAEGQNISVALRGNETKTLRFNLGIANISKSEIVISAYNENINISKKYNINITDCETFNYAVSGDDFACESTAFHKHINITNSGVHADNYTIINNTLIQISPASLRLNPGESGVFNIDINSYCGESGYKRETVIVKSALGAEKRVNLEYTVDDCYDYDIKVLDHFEDFCEYDNKTFMFILTNKGTMANSFDASITFDENASGRIYNLNSNESVNVSIESVNSTRGQHYLLVNMRSNNTCNLEYYFDTMLTVRPFTECYSGKLSVPAQFSTNSTTVTVENNGTRNNTYIIHVIARNEIGNTTLTLAPHEMATFKLNNLLSIHEEYSIDTFTIYMNGTGLYSEKNTTYYDSPITGLLTKTSADIPMYLGFSLIIALAYLIIKKK
ncbi:Uncharacterised protein [Candidatus Tiddalikarchaeum anstoanum]|nr:Uncharacterised protein [Candidatus Tiddalikarchaeum anstoanum]